MPSRRSSCPCAREFVTQLVRPDQWRMAKHVFDRGKHPAFLGRDVISFYARNGGSILFLHLGEPVAVAIVNTKHGVLLALNVLPDHRGHGLGAAIVDYLMPNFARVLDSKVPWFRRRGYTSVGEQKRGLRHRTQIMVRSGLIPLAGRLTRILAQRKKRNIADTAKPP